MQKFKYISFEKRYNLSYDILKQIDESALLFASDFAKINIENLSISEYNKHYLKRYQDNFDYFLFQYVQLIIAVFENLNKPIKEACFVDYGGGTGILSLLAKYVGFKDIVYIDIYDVSCNDAKVISKEFSVNIKDFIIGDITQLIEYSKTNNLDVICSMDVFEHIYDWEKWFLDSKNILNNPTIIFKTGTNPANPFINRKLIKGQKIAENVGYEVVEGWKSRDKAEPFYKIRKQIILDNFPDLSHVEIEKLAKTTRGLIYNDIIDVVNQYIKEGVINYRNNHPTNTCDPYTGNWEERLVSKKELKEFFLKNDFYAMIENGFYSKSFSKIKNLPKFFINLIIYFSKRENLFLSPTYTLIVKRKN